MLSLGWHRSRESGLAVVAFLKCLSQVCVNCVKLFSQVYMSDMSNFSARFMSDMSNFSARFMSNMSNFSAGLMSFGAAEGRNPASLHSLCCSNGCAIGRSAKACPVRCHDPTVAGPLQSAALRAASWPPAWRPATPHSVSRADRVLAVTSRSAAEQWLFWLTDWLECQTTVLAEAGRRR
jgi:hypothetical protein